MDDQEQMLGSLLPFHKRIVEELISEDGLCIMSAGMGWQKVVSYLQLLMQCLSRLLYADKGAQLAMGKLLKG